MCLAVVTFTSQQQARAESATSSQKPWLKCHLSYWLTYSGDTKVDWLTNSLSFINENLTGYSRQVGESADQFAAKSIEN